MDPEARRINRPFGRPWRLFLLAAVCLGVASLVIGLTRPSTRAVHDYRSGPVKTGSRTGTSFPADLGQVFTFGGIVLENSAHHPALLEAVRVDLPLDSGLAIVDVKVAGGDRGVGLVGTDPQFPPALLASHVRPFRGAEVPPLSSPRGKNGVEVLFGLRIDKPGSFGFRKVEIDYRLGDKRHTVRLEDGFLGCGPYSAYPHGCEDHEDFFRRGS